MSTDERPPIYWEILHCLHEGKEPPEHPDANLWRAALVDDGLAELTPYQDGEFFGITTRGEVVLKLRDAADMLPLPPTIDWEAEAKKDQPAPVPQEMEPRSANGKEPARAEKPAPDVSHSPDFRSVRWYGTDYTFTPMQAACVKVLWEAWEKGSPGLGQDYVLETASSCGSKLLDVFKTKKGMHPAWDTMIVSPRKGTFQLAPPG